MAGVVIALVMGSENAIPPEQWTVLRGRNGAFSGSFRFSYQFNQWPVFLLVRYLCAWFLIVRLPPQGIAALSALIAAFFYSALADFAIPTQRALVMIAVVMAGIIFQRNVETDYHSGAGPAGRKCLRP